MNVLEDYAIVSEHIPSRVVLLAKKTFKKADGWWTWIDFPKFAALAIEGKPFSTQDYLKKTPTVTGISGKGTLTRTDAKHRHTEQKTPLQLVSIPGVSL